MKTHNLKACGGRRKGGCGSDWAGASEGISKTTVVMRGTKQYPNTSKYAKAA